MDQESCMKPASYPFLIYDEIHATSPVITLECGSYFTPFSVPWLPPLRHLFLQVSLRLGVRARGQRRPRRPVQLRQDPPGLHILNGPPQHHTMDAHARLGAMYK